MSENQLDNKAIHSHTSKKKVQSNRRNSLLWGMGGILMQANSIALTPLFSIAFNGRLFLITDICKNNLQATGSQTSLSDLIITLAKKKNTHEH